MPTFSYSGKKLALACSTGLECQQYQGMKATTVHHHIGNEDGRFSRETLLNNLSNNDNHSAAKENICTANVLIIDEISM